MKPVIPPRVAELVEEAARALPGEVKPESTFDGADVFSVEDQIRLGISLAETDEKRLELQALLTRLKAAYRGMGGRAIRDVAFVNNTKFYAYLTLLPGTGLGKSIRLEDLFDLLKESDVTKGLESDAVKKAFDKAANRHELVWNLRVAKGVLPERGQDARLEYLVRYLDHAAIFGEDTMPPRPIGDTLEPVEPHQVLARVHSAETGKGGILVTGKRLTAPPGRELETRLGPGVRLSRRTGDLVAQQSGCLVVTPSGVDVTPMLRRDATAGPIWTTDSADLPAIEFAGSVFVRGGVTGPGRIRARDVFVDGDLVGVDVEVERDVYVHGAIVGSPGFSVRAGGCVKAREARGARIDALGPVTLRDVLDASEIRSADTIRIGTDGRGLFLSGRVEAMNRIFASIAGSESGGAGVSFVAGVSAFLDERMTSLQAALRKNDDRLRELLRQKVSCMGEVIDPGALAPERQDQYLTLLRLETAALELQRTMQTELERLRAASRPTGPPRVDVRRRFHPPGHVRIGTSERTVDTGLDGPRFLLGRDATVIIDRVRPPTALRRTEPPAGDPPDEGNPEGSR